MDEKDKELWNTIDREIEFVKNVREIMASTQNEIEIGSRVTKAFNKMNEKIEE